jgi:phthiocerol/phenolphthiocerol synthesis type-I polyketide synthase E
MKNSIPDPGQGIAVIGMAGRFPGADSVDALWDNLCAGVEALHHYTPEEIQAAVSDWDYLSQPHIAGLMRSPGWVPKGFRLADADKFDAGFFGYTPAEAELLDPQQRLFLECAWAALEDAGYIPDQCPGTVGVFGGATLSRYFVNNIYANRDIIFSSRDLTAGIGNEPDYVANRVAYKLNLTGPAVSVQTACSTSLVAIHLACQSLHAGESSLCLAGGVLVNFPGGGYAYQEGGMMAPDGHIRAFDARAAGTVFSEGGVGIVVLKRYADAVADGDHIHGVILGSAVSNDGAVKAGYTAPGIPGQKQVIEEALAVADLSPEAIGYVEAHGTGTPLGDPIEITALTQTYRRYTDRRAWCAIGSLKPNLGHLAPVAGVAALMKAVLAVERGLIPPQINYAQPNPRLELEASPFFIGTAPRAWDDGDRPRIAAVSSFGIGGTNAHAIVHQPPRRDTVPGAPRRRLFRLSAMTPEALRRQAANLGAYLERHPEADPRDVAHTLRVARKAMPCRQAFVAETPAELAAALAGFAREGRGDKALDPNTGTVWMFSGQGSQYARMGQALRAELPVFRETLDACFDLLAPELGGDPRALLYPGPDAATDGLAETLRQTRYAQPILFAFEYALARQMLALGLEPAAMIGHSLGEYVAACLAGVFDRDAALRLVAARGRLMQSMPPGAMLSVAADAGEAAAWLDGGIGLAADNAPDTCVLSGPAERIEALRARLDAEGRGCRPLVTSHAFHSAMMEPIVAEFAALVREARPRPPTRPFVSNVTGTWITAAEATDPDYWARHLRGTVRFAPGLRTLLAEKHVRFLEVGPGNTLCQFARRELAARKAEGAAVALVRHAREDRDDRDVFLEALGKLWATGESRGFGDLEEEPAARRIPLPGYAFARERHWVGAPQQPAGTAEEAPGKRPDPADWFYAPSFRRLPPPDPAAVDWRDSSVLLFDPDHPAFRLLGEQLTAAGAHVVTVRAGPEPVFGAEARIRPDVPEDYAALSRALPPDRPLAAVLHGWGFTGPTRLTAENCAEFLNLGFFSLLHLTQSLAEAPLRERVAILSVTTEAASVTGEEALNPAKAGVHGLHLCLGQEYPQLNSRNLDLPVAAAGSAGAEELARTLCAELRDLAGRAEHLVTVWDKNLARRGRGRFGADFAASPRPERNESLPAPRAEAVYLITGGLGGLGLAFADWLVERGARKIALLGRSEPPPETEWDGLIAAAGPGDGLAGRLARLRALRRKGAELRLVRADVADAPAVKAAVADLAASFGPIAGVLHCAGLADGGAIQTKTRAAALAVLAPKAAGTLALAEALADTPLDFLVLFSSLFAVTGGAGQAAYAAANHFLDAFAQDRGTRLGQPVLSLNWGAWSEVGMAAAHGLGGAPALPPKTLDHPYLFEVRDRGADRAVVTSHLREQDHWALREHHIARQPVMPGTGLVEAARAAHRTLTGRTRVEIAELMFFRPLFVPPEARVDVEFRFERVGGERWRVEAREASGNAALPVLTAEFAPLEEAAPARAAIPRLIEEHGAGLLDFGDGRPPVVQGEAEFLQLGPRWRVLRRVHLGANSLLGELELDPAYGADLDRFVLHPALLDMATGPIVGHLLGALPVAVEGEYLPFSYRRLRLFRPLPGRFYSHVEYRGEPAAGETLEFDIALYGPGGEPLVLIEGFLLKRVPAAALAERSPARPPLGDPLDDSVTPAEGLAAFARVFGLADAAQWIISPQSLPGLLRGLHARHNARPAERPLATRSAEGLEPPETPAQKTLTEIFEQALGVAPIGIRDNFFALGGDSVLAIQIVSAAKARGLALKPNQLFERQTVAELAELFESEAPAAPEPAAAPGTPNLAAVADSEVSEEDLLQVLKQIG